MGKFNLPKGQVRAVESTEIKVDDETRTMEFSFSSEVPYERWFGMEIISHDKDAMNLDRLNNAAPLLFNHDMDKQLGVIEKAWIGEDKRGYAKVRFSKSAFAEEKLQDIKDGILRGVSFGYMVEEMVLSKKGEPSEYTVTKSFPYEVSVVTVPADYSVGVARSLEGKAKEEIEVLIPEEKTIHADPDAASTKEKKMDNDIAKVQADAVKAERERIASINTLGEKFKKQDLAKSLIENGKSIEEARSAFLDVMGVSQKPLTEKDGEIGMSDKEAKSFSFLRAINAMANPGDRKAQEAASFEREVSLAASDKAGKAARGFMVPLDVLKSALKRDLVVGTSTAGGNLVSTDLLAVSFIELLRKRSVLQRAGAMTMNGLVGNIAIPRATGGATAYWVAESGAPTESQQAFDQVAMSPKTVGAFTDYSRKLMLQSSLDVEAFIRNDLATVLALEIDRAGLYGLGSSNQPLGLKNQVGINTVDFAATNPTFAEIIAMETAVAADNADVGTLRYLVNAAGRGHLKSTEKATGTAQFIWEAGNTVNGYGAEVSNQIVSGDYWYGNFADLMMGFWSGLDLLVDPYTGSTSGTIRVVAHQDVDVAIRHPESFCLGYLIP